MPEIRRTQSSRTHRFYPSHLLRSKLLTVRLLGSTLLLGSSGCLSPTSETDPFARDPGVENVSNAPEGIVRELTSSGSHVMVGVEDETTRRRRVWVRDERGEWARALPEWDAPDTTELLGASEPRVFAAQSAFVDGTQMVRGFEWDGRMRRFVPIEAESLPERLDLRTAEGLRWRDSVAPYQLDCSSSECPDVNPSANGTFVVAPLIRPDNPFPGSDPGVAVLQVFEDDSADVIVMWETYYGFRAVTRTTDGSLWLLSDGSLSVARIEE